MQQIVNSSSHPIAYTSANSNQNDTIFYNFVGNFVPPEWRDLENVCEKALSKTAKQLLSLVVFRLQVCYNSGNNLQDDELQEGGFIHLYNATIVKHHIKCRNTPCIKLAKNFQPYPKKFSHEAEKSFGSTRKKFQPHNIIDINNKSNISRSSESEFLKNVSEKNETVESPEQKFPQEQIEQHQEQAEPLLALSCQGSQGTLPPSEGQGLAEERISNIEDLTEKAYTAETTLAASLTSVIEKMPNSNGNDSAISSYLNASAPLNNKGWFKRKNVNSG